MLKSLLRRFTSQPSPDAAGVDFSSLHADMHSHLIPGIDDGAKSIEDSIELIRFLHSKGYSKLITTPHIMSDYFRNTPEIILEGLEALRKAVKEQNIPVTLEAAAEYYIDDGFIRKLEEEPLLTFGDKYLLMEVSYINPPDNVHQVFFRAQVLGYKPVLAHPERYPYWYRDFDQYLKFYEMGVTLQLNLNSLSGYYGPDAKKIAEKLIDTGIIGALGTDMHHTRHAAALDKATQEKYLHKILESPLINREL
jgi:tyrosine-protein phosphatase YwqE